MASRALYDLMQPLPPPGKWYELRALFAPAAVHAGGEPLPACRILECHDMHGGRVLSRSLLDPPPAGLKAEEITACLLEAVSRHGPPETGVFISPSVWLSSGEMLLNVETERQGRLLFEGGISFPPVPRRDLEEFQAWAVRRRIHCEFGRTDIAGMT